MTKKTKQRVAKTASGMGVPVSDAVRMPPTRVAANATTVKAMRAADKGKGKHLNSPGALFKDLGI